MKKNKESKKSIWQKLFSKERVDCPSCKNSIDAYMYKCPYCGNERSIDILPKKYLNMSFLSDYKEICFFLVGTLGLFLISFVISMGISSFPGQTELKTSLINLLTYIVVLALFFCITSHDTLKIGKSIHSQHKKLKTWIFIIAGLALIFLFSFLYQYILSINGIDIGTSQNQSEIEKIVKAYPAIAFFFVVLFGPIVEEFTYRVGCYTYLRKRNRYLAYVVTVLLFALMHSIPSFINAPEKIAMEALNIPLYIIPSLVLAINYEYCGLSASLYTHILNNLISYISILAFVK